MLGIGTEPAFANGNRALLLQTGALKGLAASSREWSSEHSSYGHMYSACYYGCRIAATHKPRQGHACTGRACQHR